MTDAIPEVQARACGNCGAALSGDFCPVCGQQDREVRRPFWRILGQFLHAVFDLDGRVYRSLYLLYTRPGFLSSEYIHGRRAHYTPPLRMFLVLSISFFLSVSIVGNLGDPESRADALAEGAAPDASAGPLPGQPLRGILAEDDDDEDGDFNFDIEQVRTAMAEVQIPFLPEATGERLKERLISQLATNFNEMRDSPGEFFREFFSESLEYVTIFILMMMPLLALLQAGLFVFKRRYYVEHFMLTLHNHAFLIVTAFLLAATGFVAAWLPVLETMINWLDLALILWAIAYLYLSLKNFYGSGMFYSGLVFFTASMIYSILMTAGLTIFLLIVFLLY